jgi:hypothetical protein
LRKQVPNGFVQPFRQFLTAEDAQTAGDSASASDFSYASEILEKPASPATEVSGAKNKDARVSRVSEPN